MKIINKNGWLTNFFIGQKLKINARYEDLNRENGDRMAFVAKKDDVVVVKQIRQMDLLVCFYEDTVTLHSKNREMYGEFVVNLNQVYIF